VGGFNTGLDTVHLHRPTGAPAASLAAAAAETTTPAATPAAAAAATAAAAAAPAAAAAAAAAAVGVQHPQEALEGVPAAEAPRGSGARLRQLGVAPQVKFESKV